SGIQPQYPARRDWETVLPVGSGRQPDSPCALSRQHDESWPRLQRLRVGVFRWQPLHGWNADSCAELRKKPGKESLPLHLAGSASELVSIEARKAFADGTQFQFQIASEEPILNEQSCSSGAGASNDAWAKPQTSSSKQQRNSKQQTPSLQARPGTDVVGRAVAVCCLELFCCLELDV